MNSWSGLIGRLLALLALEELKSFITASLKKILAKIESASATNRTRQNLFAQPRQMQHSQPRARLLMDMDWTKYVWSKGARSSELQLGSICGCYKTMMHTIW